MAAGGVLVGRGYVSIRPEFEGDWSRSVNTRASGAGRSASSAFSKAFGAGLRGLGALAGVAIAANLSTAAAAAAGLAPALATAGAAAGALKLGLSGVGDAFKQAFADHTAEANAAASATRAVESAQRGLSKAQQGLADARVQAAERVKEAQRGVADAEQNLARVVEESAQRQADAQQQVRDAERDLRSAQQDAIQAQLSLNDARREAARTLQDMNDRLAEGRLNEREAILRVKEAEKQLHDAQAKGVTGDQLEKLQIAYDRAKLNLQEQQRETKQLAQDTAKANKAGIEGSAQVTQAKKRIADANQTVADRERALSKAQEDARRAGVDGARQVADAQRQLADAQAGVTKARQEGARQIRDAEQAVADAAQAVADAQAAAASQTSKFDQAMSKLAPNAQSFVRAVQGIAPSWDAMRLSVQNELFKGLDTTVTGLARSTMPILQRNLTQTAGIWNSIAKNAASGVQEMAKSGMLDKILKGANDNLKVFKDTPKQLITAFGQLTVAAQPAFNRLLQQMSGFITRFTDSIGKAFESGGLQNAIDTAFTIIGQVGTALGNALGIVGSIGKAASDAGGQIIGVLGSVLAELNKLFKSDEMQANLRNLFAAVSQIVGAIVPVIGGVVKAVVPLLVAIAQPVAQLATVLGPVLQQLVTTLGAALMPVVQALMPVLVQVGTAIVQIVQAVMPLLQPIATLITQVVNALAPALTPIIATVVQLVGVLVGPLTQVVQALTPALTTIGQVIAQAFIALQPVLTPLVGLIGQVASLIAQMFTTALTRLMSALQPLIPVGMQLITTVLQALLPILPTLGRAFGVIVTALLQMMEPLAGVIGSLAQQLAPVIAQLAPVLAQFAGVFATLLAQALPPLAQAFLTLVGAVTPILPVLGQLLGLTLRMAAGVLMQLLPSLLELVQAAVDLVVALLPILPPLTQLIGMVAELATKVLSYLLPPLVSLAGFFVNVLVGTLTTVIGWVSGLIRVIADLVKWVTKNLGPAFQWLNDRVIQPVWRFIQQAISNAWNNNIKLVFGYINGGIGTVGKTFRWLRDNVVKPVWDWITSKISGVWRNGISPVFDALKYAIGKVAAAFGISKDAIGKSWDKIKNLTKAPINFVIGTVWNHGILAAWRKISDWVPGLPKLKELPLLAQGGTLPVQPGVFNKPTAIVGEGRSQYPEFVIPTDPRYRARAFALWQAAGGQLMAGGGILGDIIGGIKNIGGKVGGFFKDAASFLKNPGKAVESLMGKLLKPLNNIKNSAWGKLAFALPKAILKGLKDLVTFGGGGGDIGGTIPKGQRLAVINQALAAAGVPPPGTLAQWQAGLNTLIQRESGWNPRAINRWDINAKNGVPSQGLAQTIPPTWAAYVPKSLRSRGILDPVANVAAAIRYIVSRYHNITNVQQANANKPPAGYDAGGWLQPGVTTAVNKTRQPEAVLTATQWQTMRAAVAMGGASRFEGDLYLDSGEFLGRVRGEAQQVVNRNNSQLLTALSARPRR